MPNNIGDIENSADVTAPRTLSDKYAKAKPAKIGRVYSRNGYTGWLFDLAGSDFQSEHYASRSDAEKACLCAYATRLARSRLRYDIERATESRKRLQKERDDAVDKAAAGLHHVDLISELMRRLSEGGPNATDIRQRLSRLDLAR